MKKISIVIPAKDEESTIGYVLDEINRQTAAIDTYDFEVIVVADHCSDKTESIAKQKNAAVYINPGKPGKGNAIRTGVERCRGDIIVMLDADGSHDPKDLYKFLNAIESGSYLVIGSRSKGGSDEYEIVRLLGNTILTLLFCLFFRISLTDVLNGYKAFKKEVFYMHKYKSRGFEIEIELLYSALSNGYKVSEVSSHERTRMGGNMKSHTFVDGVKFLSAIIKWGIRYRLCVYYI